MSDQILALAGVFQASELVRQAANHGTWSGYAADACLASLFRMEADSAADVFGGKEHLHLGLETLLAVLSGEQQSSQTLQLTVGLLQLQGKFLRQRAMVERVGDRLQEIAVMHPAMEPHERHDLQAQEVAGLYQETVSTLTPRIVVQGRPQYLQNPRTVHWIRALLFAGLRAAVLWRQLGGGRLNLLFGRRRLLEQAHRLVQG